MATGYPAGYRFVPTDAEIIAYYLARQTAGLHLPPNPILEVQIYDYSPDDIFKNHGLSEDKESYFFSSRMKKYLNGGKPDRAAGAGFWKATGAKINVCDKNGVFVGCKASLVYHTGTPKNFVKTKWLMTEYQIKQNAPPINSKKNMLLDEWVVCKIYRTTRSSKKKETEDEIQQESACGDQPNGPVTQVIDNNPGTVYPDVTVDQMRQFFQGTPLVSDGKIPQLDPQPSHDGNFNLGLNDMRGNGVNGYFQEASWNFLSQSDPQSSHGGQLNPIQGSSDMTMMQYYQGAPSASHADFIPQPDPQPSYNGQISSTVDLDFMELNEVTRFLLETPEDDLFPHSDPGIMLNRMDSGPSSSTGGTETKGPGESSAQYSPFDFFK